MQVNNAGVSGIIIEDSDLISTVFANRGVRLLACCEI